MALLQSRRLARQYRLSRKTVIPVALSLSRSAARVGDAADGFEASYRPNRRMARACALAASTSRSLGGADVTSERRRVADALVGYLPGRPEILAIRPSRPTAQPALPFLANPRA